MARPTKYSAAMRNAICNQLKTGCTRTAAAESLGIGYETFRRWMSDYEEFWGAVTRAEAEAEAMFTATIAQAAKGTEKEPGDWRAAESWLKRRRRAEWGDNITHRADREVAGLLAELFPDDAAESFDETASGETAAKHYE